MTDHSNLAAPLILFVRDFINKNGPWTGSALEAKLAQMVGDQDLAEAVMTLIRVRVYMGTSWTQIQAEVASMLAGAPAGEGFTQIPIAADAKTWYVSSSTGSDDQSMFAKVGSALGLTAAAGSIDKPFATIEKALNAARTAGDGLPNRVLLKTGDTFVTYEADGVQVHTIRWDLSGRTLAEPFVLGTYGDGPRPIVRHQFSAFGDSDLHDFAFLGIQIDGGFSLVQRGRNGLFEDCAVRFGSEGLTSNPDFDGAGKARFKNLRVRRNIIVDQAAPTSAGHVQGSYFAGIDGLLIEQNVYDNNGMPADIFRHDLYVQNGNTNVTVIDNIIGHASSHGMQLRCGGEVLFNLFTENPINLQVGGGNDVEPAGVLATVLGNAFVGGGDIGSADQPRGWGMFFQNIRQGTATDNLLIDSTGHMQFPLSLSGQPAGDHGEGLGGCHMTVARNYRRGWACSQHPDAVEPGYLLQFTPGKKDAQLLGTTVTGMEDHFIAGDPNQNIDVSLNKYMPGFLEKARNRGRGQWDPAITAKAYVTWARAQLKLPVLA